MIIQIYSTKEANFNNQTARSTVRQDMPEIPACWYCQNVIMMVVMIITIIMIIMVKMIMISIYHHALLVVVVISIGELGKLCSKSISIIIITRPWPAGLYGIVARIQLHMPCFAPMGNYDSARRDFPKLSGNRGNDKTPWTFQPSNHLTFQPSNLSTFQPSNFPNFYESNNKVGGAFTTAC